MNFTKNVFFYNYVTGYLNSLHVKMALSKQI